MGPPPLELVRDDSVNTGSIFAAILMAGVCAKKLPGTNLCWGGLTPIFLAAIGGPPPAPGGPGLGKANGLLLVTLPPLSVSPTFAKGLDPTITF